MLGSAHHPPPSGQGSHPLSVPPGLFGVNREQEAQNLWDPVAHENEHEQLRKQLQKETVNSLEYEKQVLELRDLARRLSSQQQAALDNSTQLHWRYRQAIKLAKRSQEKVQDLKQEKAHLIHQQYAHSQAIEQLTTEVMGLRQHIQFLSTAAQQCDQRAGPADTAAVDTVREQLREEQQHLRGQLAAAQRMLVDKRRQLDALTGVHKAVYVKRGRRVSSGLQPTTVLPTARPDTSSSPHLVPCPVQGPPQPGPPRHVPVPAHAPIPARVAAHNGDDMSAARPPRAGGFFLCRVLGPFP